MLSADFNERPTIEQILNHPWLANQSENDQAAAEVVEHNMLATHHKRLEKLEKQKQDAIKAM